MKKLLLTSLLIFLLFPTQVIGHSGGLPFFKINGKYVDPYPVFLTTVAGFNAPHDAATENYKVNQGINFEIELANSPISPENASNTKLYWDFGDDTTGEGLKTSHIYSKPGSYVIQIYSYMPKFCDKALLLDSVFLNVIPEDGFIRPTTKVLANGQAPKDPVVDVLSFDFKDPINFSAEYSGPGKAQSYFWDFGDGTSADTAVTTHKYPQNIPYIYAVARIKDDQGFFADGAIQLQNSNYQEGSTPAPSLSNNVATPTMNLCSQNKVTNNFLPILIGLGLAGALIYVAFRLIMKGRPNPSDV